MAGSIYCIDNDILKKLATFDLFDKTVSLFNATPEKIRVLETAKYKFQGDWDKIKKGKARKPEALFVNYERTIELATTLPQIGQLEVDQDLFIQISQCESIDEGEAILTVHITEILQKDEEFQAFIFTGDKNYLRALAAVDFPTFQKILAHRFWCLEQLILRDIETYGFESVRDQIVPVRKCDKAIKAVFGSGALSTEPNAVEILTSYIETLRQETGNLLHPYPHGA
ncbi:hypothetical protein GS597_11110 [Synechococcales cyanobacterium C]|uniref:Uncharacterized protein n=1 Tax=Petrachloros mirabilis ULC683 TaxID=2781853 RepID=A0A8K1ZZZ0_9CYAN|nr:hypothetical protein [Petrachloros mirabilis]NCJ07046.1 hypothetical protein [Petrachloros mirabilis ULC683]